jgi:hypothetical protein
MKKIIYSLLTFTLVFSCSDTDDHGVDVNNFNGESVAYYTDGVSGSYFVTSSADAYMIEVGATDLSSSDRTYTLEIDESSTATEGVDFSLGNMSVTIPADSYFGSIDVQGIFAGTTAEGSNLVLNLVGEEAMVNAQFDLFIVQLCVSDIAGMYSMTTTYGYHDFLPSYSTNIQDIEIVEIGEGVYSIADFTGGLYSDGGPYNGAYSTTATYAEITENCGLISWSGQSDPWGAMIPLEGGENSVDANGVITMSWFCEGYGENGVSVYTPL